MLVDKLCELYSVLKELVGYQDTSEIQDTTVQDTSEDQDTAVQDTSDVQDTTVQDTSEVQDERNMEMWCFILSQTLFTMVGVASEQEVGVVIPLDTVMDLLK